jgi:glyoxylase-like metal-dependent hydrolase (beta-lactamase superfamily II)
MKRALKWLGLVVLVLAVAGAFVLYSVFGNNKPTVDGQRLVPGVQTVQDRFVNMFLLDTGPGAVALIDAGLDDSGKAILAALTQRGLSRDAVKGIFLTHGHGDHTAGCKVFPGADVYALADEVSLIGAAAKVTHSLKDGDLTTVGELSVETFAVPGHTPGSAVFLARGVLFFGDSAGASKEGRLLKAVRLFSKDSNQTVASLQALAGRLSPRASQVEVLAFGHTGPLDGFGPLAAFAAR